MWVVAIPSFRRARTLRDKTLALLARHGVPPERITVFVADAAEAEEYRGTLDDATYGALQVARPGMAAVRNYITHFYPVGQQILCVDDDVRDLKELDPAQRNKPLQDLGGFVTRAFEEAARTGFRLWGIYPVCNDCRGMRDRVTSDLRYIVGCCFGIVNPGPVLECTLDDKEDFQRSVIMYLLDGGVLRFEHVAPVTKYWTTPGGMQITRTQQRIEASAHAMAKAYTDLARLTIKKRGVEVRLKDARATRTFGVEALAAYSPPRLQMDELLAALQSKKWTKRLRPNVLDKSCFTELAHKSNANAHPGARARHRPPSRLHVRAAE